MFSLQGLGQDYISNIKQFGIESGLTHFEIFTVFQDSEGLMWIGTRHGLHHYNSQQFISWNKKENGLSHEKVLDIEEDTNGYLWLLITDNWNEKPLDINLIDVQTHEVFSFEEKFGNSIGLSFEDVIELHTNSNGEIFITTHETIYHYHPSKGFQTIDWFKEGYEVDFVSSNNVFTVRTNEYLLRINVEGEVLDSVNLKKWDTSLIFLTTDKTGQHIYHAQGKGFFQLTINGLKPIHFKDADRLNGFLYNSPFYAFSYRKQDNTYWFSLGNKGLMVFHPRKGLIYDFHQEINHIQHIYIDNGGLAWMVLQDGLIQVNLEKNKFKRFLYKNVETKNGLNKTISPQMKSTRNIFKHKNNLYVISNKGSYVIDVLSNTTTSILPPAGYSLLPLVDNKILYSHLGILQLYDYKQHKKIKSIPYPLILGNIWSIYQDKFNRIWLGGNKALGLLPHLDSVPKLYDLHKTYPSFKNAVIYQFYEKNDIEVILVTTKGLFVLNTEKNKITDHYWSEGTGKNYFPNDIIHHLHQDKKDNHIFWLATTKGLVKWNTQTHQHQIIDSQDGLSNEIIYGVYEDNFNYLWMSSNYGITKINKTSFQITNYLPKDGISHFEFNRVSHYQDKEGVIYFGGLNGLTVFHPKDFYDEQKKVQLPMKIVQLQQFSGTTEELVDKTSEILKTNKIIIRPSDRFFNLEFALLDYKQNHKTLYSYKIEGLEKDWTNTFDNSLHISRLPYGKYTLKIKGQAHHGSFSEDILQIKIEVKKPFYRAIWFIVVILLLITDFGLLFYRWRTIQLRKRNQQLEETIEQRTAEIQADKLTIQEQANQLLKLDELKSRFFVNVSHELRTPLTLILSPIQALLKNMGQFSKEEIANLLSLVRQNTLKLLHLTEEVLHLSKLENNQLKLKEEAVFFHSYFQHFFQSFIPLTQSKRINYCLECDIDSSLCILLDKTKFEHIVGNLISNAIKYTREYGIIDVIVQIQKQRLIVSIQDNGIGIHPDDLPYIFDRYYQTQQDTKWVSGTGIGLALANELTTLFQGTLNVQSDYKKGSIFVFEMPYKIVNPITNHLNNEFELQNTSGWETPIDTNSNPLKTPKDQQKTTLLIVEDNEELRAFLTIILSKTYHIIAVENGQVALKKLATIHCDLIVSDIMMPVMDGFELLEKLKKHPKWINIPIILLSAKTELTDKLKALTIGIDDYITKPFAMEELLARIQNSLRNVANRSVTIEKENTKLSSSRTNKGVIPKDLVWLEQLNKILEKELTNNHLNISDIAYRISLSESQTRRKIKTITGLTPNKYIREFKLSKARNLLEIGQVNTLLEVTQAVGFSTPHYFASLFEARFGKKPQEYFKRKDN